MKGEPFDFDGSKNQTHPNIFPSGLSALEGDDSVPSLLSENGGSDDNFVASGLANTDDDTNDDDTGSAPEDLGVEVPTPDKVLNALLTLANHENENLKRRLLAVEHERNELRAELECVVQQNNTVDLGWKLEEEDHFQTRKELEELKAAMLSRIESNNNENDTVESLREKLRDTNALLHSETDHFQFKNDKLREQLEELKVEKNEAMTKLESESKKVVKYQRTELALRHDYAMLENENAELRSGKSG